MRVRVSDYIADFLIEHGITDIFTVVGGGAMHMNDSFGHNRELHCTYNHHEQASAMAAEAYFRVSGKMAAVCVTSGPGAINALNGVVGAYQDSIPMLVFSGQTKTELTVFKSGLDLRTLGNQEFDIVASLGKMVKYAEMVMDAGKIRYCLEKAYKTATEGRPGPSWLDIPLDVQGTYIETEDLKGYEDGEESYPVRHVVENPELHEARTVDGQIISQVVRRLADAKRPVFYAGNGIRISGSVEKFRRLVQRLEVPVVTCWDSIDLMETDDDYYAGRGGIMGDRAGNFAVQNSDLLICIGTRLNIYQVGYHVDTWAREAYVVVNDIDAEELKKPTIRVDLPVCCDAGRFIEELEKAWEEAYGDVRRNSGFFREWVRQCQAWKNKYPVVQEKHYADGNFVNVYAFVDKLSKMLPEKAVTVVSNGSASVVGSQSYYIGRGQRFLMNCGLSSMGYGLPAAVGACVANNSESVICIEGDGSIMMNLQELQTVVTNRLPVKIFVINNQGYHQIRITQKSLFEDKLVGVGPESGDLSFPDFKKVSAAFDIPYYCVEDTQSLNSVLGEVLQNEGCLLCEVFCDTEQAFEPKSATRKLEDGRLISPPLEDLAPFLSRDELRENMYIDLME